MNAERYLRDKSALELYIIHLIIQFLQASDGMQPSEMEGLRKLVWLKMITHEDIFNETS